jgi:DUF1365 family protein
MAIANGLLIADVVHTRDRPKYHHLHYHVYYLCVALADLPQLTKLWVMRHNRFGLFSFYDRDHAPANEAPEAWIRARMAEWNITHADGDIVLLTMPRILGYGFNPVSFWFCLDKAGALRAVLSEVRNTFGEKHCYWSFHDDGRVITQDDRLTAKKIFHVSPFMEVVGHYAFRFFYADKKVGVWIDYHDAAGKILSTSMVGKRRDASSTSLLYCFFRYPLVTLKVIGLIHYHALKLMAKGIRYHRKPNPPTTEISR